MEPIVKEKKLFTSMNVQIVHLPREWNSSAKSGVSKMQIIIANSFNL